MAKAWPLAQARCQSWLNFRGRNSQETDPTWAQYFAVYTVVLGTDQPQQLPEFMTYQFEIAK